MQWALGQTRCSEKSSGSGRSEKRIGSSLYNRGAVNGVEIAGPMQVHKGSDRDLVALAHVEILDPEQVHEGRQRP